MKQLKNVPAIRFKDNKIDWNNVKLGTFSKFRRGSFPQPYGLKKWYGGDGAKPFVQVVDVTKNLNLVGKTKQTISVLAQTKSILACKGKIVVTLQGSIGRVAILQYDAYVDRTLLIFEDFQNETNEYFWAYSIQNIFEIERSSIKALGENYGMVKVLEDDDIQLQHKATVNELALIMMARNKYGFK